MSISIFILNTALLAIALINSFTIRKPAKQEIIDESVAVLLPVRNEEANILRILGELTSQENLSHYHVIVINDGSTDHTEGLARSITSERITVINAPALREGWIGKVHALDSGLNSFDGNLPEFLICIDADVTLQPTAIAQLVSSAERTKLDFISAYPAQIALTWSERLIQPLLQWSWMTTVILRLAEKFPRPSTVVCNGQFLLTRTDALIASGGFEAIAGKVLDDIELGRAMVRSGFSGTVIDGSEIAATRMYSGFREIAQGYGKSLHKAFGGVLGSIVVTLFIIATSIAPLVLAITGDLAAILALLAIVLTRTLSAYTSHSRIRDSILHPISALVFLYLLYFAWTHRSQAQWKGRTV